VKLPVDVAARLYWAEQRRRGRAGIRERLEWLQHTQFLSPGEIETLQFEKLRRMLEHCFDTVPYYRDRMQERGLTPKDFKHQRDLSRLPLLTRDALRTNQATLLSTSADLATVQRNFSSGSTGQRAEFVQDLNFRLWMRAHQLRTYGWCSNFRLGEGFVLLWGSEIYWKAKGAADAFENALSNRREFNTFRLSSELVRRFLRKLVEFKPALISTYTNAMHLIAKEASRQAVQIPGLRSIQGTSEPLPPPVREKLAATFGCEVYDKYGSRESNIVSHECSRHEHMHIQSENVFVEFIDAAGRPCAPGQTGRVVLTTLNNWSMPLIRYATSDLAAPVAGTCRCGIGLPLMTSVAGREQDLIFTPSGDAIDAYLFSYLIMRFPEIHWFQIVQHELGRLRIKLMAPAGVTHARLEQITERIQHHSGYPFKIDFEELTDMPDTSTGKFRLCVSELPRAPQT
jgi:phenylacetate-CoA ligase